MIQWPTLIPLNDGKSLTEIMSIRRRKCKFKEREEGVEGTMECT
jgi:hypothetical protein